MTNSKNAQPSPELKKLEKKTPESSWQSYS